MKKTPLWGNALLILNVHLAHDTLKFYKKFIRFSLDILRPSTYCEGNNRIYPFLACIATMHQGILFLTSEGMV